jgi:hypothetical protein
MNVVCEDIGNPNVKIIEEFHFLFTPFRGRGVTLHYEDRFSAAELSHWQF